MHIAQVNPRQAGAEVASPSTAPGTPAPDLVLYGPRVALSSLVSRGPQVDSTGVISALYTQKIFPSVIAAARTVDILTDG